jgi:putative transposase
MQRKYAYRRKLPHCQPDFKAFFITFSTYQRWTLPESVRHIVIDTCLAGNGRKFSLYAVVVMPDHVHLVLAPKYDGDGPVSIAEIMHAIKGASAHRINKSMGRRGKVWEEESFDRALRREESIEDKVD